MKNNTNKISISQKIIRNTIFNIIGRFWGILVALVLTPYIIHHIGIERYGIWAIVGVLTGYFGLLDFGIGTSFVKYISEYYTKEDYKKINQVVNTGFIFYSIFTIIIIVLAFLIINPLLTLFKIPANLYNEAVFVFLLGIILFGVSNALSPFVAIQGGLQRMDISNKVAIAISIPMVIGTIFFLEAGYGLPGLMVNNAIILVISSIANIVIAFRILPELRFNPFLFNKEMFKKLFGFGYKMQVSVIAGLLHFQMDKLLLAYFLNIGFVAYYTVAAQLASVVRGIPLLLISAIFPAASELEAKADKDSLHTLYFRSMKYVVLIGLPISLLVILFAKPFINLWLGEGFERSALTLQILTIGYFFNIMTGPGFFILNGIGKPQYAVRNAIMAAVLNLFLSILLVIKIGYFGVVIGTSIATIIAAIVFISIFHRVTKIPLGKVINAIIVSPLIASIVPAIIIYIILNNIGSINIIKFASMGFFYFLFYFLTIIKLKHMDNYDKYLLNNFLRLNLFKLKNAKPH